MVESVRIKKMDQKNGKLTLFTPFPPFWKQKGREVNGEETIEYAGFQAY